MPLGVMPGVPPMKGEGECAIGCHAWGSTHEGRGCAPLGVMPGGGGVPHWVSCLGFHRRGSAPLGVMPGVPPMKGGGVPHWVSCLGEGECPIGCHAWGSTGGGVRHWVSCLGFHP